MAHSGDTIPLRNQCPAQVRRAMYRRARNPEKVYTYRAAWTCMAIHLRGWTRVCYAAGSLTRTINSAPGVIDRLRCGETGSTGGICNAGKWKRLRSFGLAPLKIWHRRRRCTAITGAVKIACAPEMNASSFAIVMRAPIERHKRANAPRAGPTGRRNGERPAQTMATCTYFSRTARVLSTGRRTSRDRASSWTALATCVMRAGCTCATPRGYRMCQ